MFSDILIVIFFFFQAEDGIRDVAVTGVQTCALPIYDSPRIVHVRAGTSRGDRCHRKIFASDIRRAPRGYFRCPTIIFPKQEPPHARRLTTSLLFRGMSARAMRPCARHSPRILLGEAKQEEPAVPFSAARRSSTSGVAFGTSRPASLGSRTRWWWSTQPRRVWQRRSEEHTSELQSRLHIVCRL